MKEHPLAASDAAEPKERHLQSVGAALALVIGTALLPWPGQWALLKTIVPLAIVIGLARYRGASGAGLMRALGLAVPPGLLRCLGLGTLLGVVIYGLNLVIVRPLGRWLFDQPTDVSSFAAMKGSFAQLLVFLAFMWLLAAVGEEVIWRGFVFRALGEWFGGGRWAWVLALVISSAVFGALHVYQGPRGVLHATVGGLVNCGLYQATGRRNLWLPILVHGIGNTISFVLIYLDRYEALINRLCG